MPNWKRVIVSGSDASLTSLFVLTSVTGSSFIGSFTGSLFGTASWATNFLTSSVTSASYAFTASSAVSAFTASSAISSSLSISSSYAYTASSAVSAFTASSAVSASYVLNAVSASYAFTASSAVSSSRSVTASFAFTASSADNFLVRQTLTASAALISGSGTQRLTVVGSGSAQPLFTVLGSQGELFSITDSLSGSLFSVNDISGLPIFEVFSDSTTLMGNYSAPMLITTFRTGSVSVGANTIYALPTASYDGVFVDYTIKSGSNARAGNFSAIWTGTAVNFMDNSTVDFGNTSGFVLGAQITGGNLVVTGSATTTGWTVKTIIRSI